MIPTEVLQDVSIIVFLIIAGVAMFAIYLEVMYDMKVNKKKFELLKPGDTWKFIDTYRDIEGLIQVTDKDIDKLNVSLVVTVNNEVIKEDTITYKQFFNNTVQKSSKYYVKYIGPNGKLN